MNLLEKLQILINTPSDINEHLGLLSKLAATHDRVIELGTRYGVSTVALLAGGPKMMRSIDLVDLLNHAELDPLIAPTTDFAFIQGNSLEVEPRNADLLFIDTLHTGQQVYAELTRWAPGISRTIALHDTVTFGTHGEVPGSLGLLSGISRFLRENRGVWELTKEYRNNNGLMILSRKSLIPAIERGIHVLME